MKVTVGLNPEANDLVSSLAADLAPDLTKSLSTKRQVIIEPSEVISFQLLRDAAPPPYDAAVGRRSERATFKYPKSVYLDQFMKESYHIADEKRAEQRRLLQEVKDMETKKKQLLHHNVGLSYLLVLERGCSRSPRYPLGQGHPSGLAV